MRKSLKIAKTVNIRNLRTENDQSIFKSILASLYFQNNDFKNAKIEMNLAIKINHKSILDEEYNKLSKEINNV